MDKYFFPLLLSRSAHQTPNFTNPEFQFPQFKVLHAKCFFLFSVTSYLYWHFWVYFDINLKLLSGKNTQKLNKQKIRDVDKKYIEKNWPSVVSIVVVLIGSVGSKLETVDVGLQSWPIFWKFLSSLQYIITASRDSHWPADSFNSSIK